MSPLSLAGPQPASGGAGSTGCHHPQTDWPNPGGRPEWFTGYVAGAKSTGMHIFFDFVFNFPLHMWYVEYKQEWSWKWDQLY